MTNALHSRIRHSSIFKFWRSCQVFGTPCCPHPGLRVCKEQNLLRQNWEATYNEWTYDELTSNEVRNGMIICIRQYVSRLCRREMCPNPDRLHSWKHPASHLRTTSKGTHEMVCAIAFCGRKMPPDTARKNVSAKCPSVLHNRILRAKNAPRYRP